MRQVRLNGLVILSVERNEGNNMVFDAIIKEFANVKVCW